jgi:hypothetical protein
MCSMLNFPAMFSYSAYQNSADYQSKYFNEQFKTNRDLISRYQAYKILDYKDEYDYKKILIYVPARENAFMPRAARPKTDAGFFLVAMTAPDLMSSSRISYCRGWLITTGLCRVTYMHEGQKNAGRCRQRRCSAGKPAQPSRGAGSESRCTKAEAGTAAAGRDAHGRGSALRQPAHRLPVENVSDRRELRTVRR